AEVDSLWTQLTRSLSSYEIERIGIRREGRHNRRYSEIAEAMRRFLGTNSSSLNTTKVPISTGRIGLQSYSGMDQAIVERRIFRILPPGCDDDSDDAPGVRWGAIFGLNNYMEQTHPDLLDELLALPVPLVLSQSYGFMSKPDTVSLLRLKWR